MTPDLTRELDLARALALEAGRLIREVYATDFAVTDKGGELGPVTEADQRANAFIVRELRRAFPGDGVVAEESKDQGDGRRFRRCWFVDPLDGTREFVSRNGEFAVQIGLAIDGEARLGVVHKPVDGRLYAGVVGEGCELQVSGNTRVLGVSTMADPKALRLVVSRSRPNPRTSRVVELLGISSVTPCGSVGVKCGLLAEGLADVYVHATRYSSRWDACAPEAVLRAAGGVFTALDGHAYRYDDGEIENLRGLFGCNVAALPIVRAAVDQVLRERPLDD